MADNSPPLIERLFVQLGFQVARIPEEPPAKRADYRVSDSVNTYIVELKHKHDADEVLQEYSDSLDVGDVFLRSEKEAYRDAISKKMDDAAEQLQSTAISPDDFQLVWFELAGLDRELQWEQTFCTIYGIVLLIPYVPGRPRAKPCYYFKHNVAWRQQNIDAFFVSDGRSITLALNPFSLRREAFIGSPLQERLAEHNAVCDPIAMEQAGSIYVADCGTPRKNTDAVLEYLQQKYNVERFLDIEWTNVTATAEVRPLDVRQKAN